MSNQIFLNTLNDYTMYLVQCCSELFINSFILFFNDIALLRNLLTFYLKHNCVIKKFCNYPRSFFLWLDHIMNDEIKFETTLRIVTANLLLTWIGFNPIMHK